MFLKNIFEKKRFSSFSIQFYFRISFLYEIFFSKIFSFVRILFLIQNLIRMIGNLFFRFQFSTNYLHPLYLSIFNKFISLSFHIPRFIRDKTIATETFSRLISRKLFRHFSWKYFHTDSTQFSRQNKSTNPSFHSFSFFFLLFSSFFQSTEVLSNSILESQWSHFR